MKYLILFTIPFLIWACNGNKDLSKNKHPEWLESKLDSLKSLSLQNPPLAVYSYIYNSEKVYYFTSPCCDQFTDLYNEKGKLICHPDGGIKGTGDGNCSDFFDKRTGAAIVWQQEK